MIPVAGIDQKSAAPLILPVSSAAHVRSAARTVFGFNRNTVDKSHAASQIERGLELSRVLNSWTEVLERETLVRESHVDRTGVAHAVGDVLQHRDLGWRGIVTYWTKGEDGSVTYALLVDEQEWRRPEVAAGMVDDLAYSGLLPDELLLQCEKAARDSGGDSPGLTQDRRVGLLSAFLYDTTCAIVPQSDLVPLPRHLARVNATKLGCQSLLLSGHSLLTPHEVDKRVQLPFFEKFCVESNKFLPSQELAYLFPSDGEPAPSVVDLSDMTPSQVIFRDSVNSLTLKVHNLIPEDLPVDHHLKIMKRIIQNYLNQPEHATSTTVSFLSTMISDVFTIPRALARLEAAKPTFKVGEVVIHKKYNFRGVVTQIDPYSRFDVRNWDGLAGIENLDQPFYVVLPDKNDSENAFGGGGGRWRYVIQENLALVEKEEDRKLQLSEALADALGVSYDEKEGEWVVGTEFELRTGLHAEGRNAVAMASIRDMEQLVGEWLYSLRRREAVEGGLTSSILAEELAVSATSWEEFCAFGTIAVETSLSHRDPEIRNRYVVIGDTLESHGQLIGNAQEIARIAIRLANSLTAYLTSLLSIDK
jgi:hemimethylated DNA binding protein